LLGIVIEGPADFDHTLGQRIVRNGRIRPDGIDQRRLGDQVTRVIDQIAEDIKGFGPEGDLLGASPQNPIPQI
jgi:hypothetical protein